MPAIGNPENIRRVQKIACVNNAGFVMNFHVKSGEEVLGNSGNYPINQTRTIDLSEQENLKKGDPIKPVIQAILGNIKEGPQVVYAPNGQTATFSVTGTTLNYEITLL